MSLEEKIAILQNLIDQMTYVKDGEYVFSTHVNVFVDYLTTAVDLTKQLYEKFKARVGADPEIETWIAMAETRYGFTRKVKFGDVIKTADHNLLIDSFKPLELALKKMEKNL